MIRWPSRSRTWPGSNGSIMPCCSAMRRIHLSLLMLIDSWSRLREDRPEVAPILGAPPGPAQAGGGSGSASKRSKPQ